MNTPKYEKSYTFLNDFTGFDVANAIANFRREFGHLEGVVVKIPVEKEYRLRGLSFDFSYTKGVAVELGLQEPNTILIQSTD